MDIPFAARVSDVSEDYQVIIRGDSVPDNATIWGVSEVDPIEKDDATGNYILSSEDAAAMQLLPPLHWSDVSTVISLSSHNRTCLNPRPYESFSTRSQTLDLSSW